VSLGFGLLKNDIKYLMVGLIVMINLLLKHLLQLKEEEMQPINLTYDKKPSVFKVF